MEIRIETKAENRKDLVKAIEQLLGERSVYLGAPDFGYKVGDFTVDRGGTILTENEEKAKEIRAMLAAKGFCTEGDEEMAYEGGTSIRVPIGTDEAQAVINLINMLHSKQYLLNRSAGAEGFKVSDALITSLGSTEFANADGAVSHIMQTADYGQGFSFEDGCIVFSGFPYTEDSEKVRAYCELAAAMVRTAREQKRIKADETIEENEKYYMRVWLVRLGFDGKEAKETRRVLLENLKGHTAFRTEADKLKWNERQKERKAEAAAERGVE